jgi:cytochrome c-type biogenesis protein CcmF
MWWSYEVLGWGGYWAWDPVENASFMPWLTATAFLHSAMVQERRNMLRVWNMSLIIATFLLTVLGTFLTRSGVLSSVHAFGEGPIGMYFLVFMAAVLVFSLALLAGRSTELKSAGNLDSMVSRESAFLLNNLLFTAFTFTVLLGTLYPLLAEALRGVKVSVGAPFFNKMTLPICAALLFLVGVGPMLPWRVADRQQLRRTMIAPAVGLILGLALSLLAGVRSVYGLLAFAFAGFALVSNVQEFAQATAARRRHAGQGVATSFLSLFRVNPRRFGGYTAHIGIILAAIGIAASSEFRLEREATMRPGDTIEIAGYRLRFDRLEGFEEPHRFVVAANFSILDGERATGLMNPRLNYYTARGGEPITTPSVRSRVTNDLYMTLLAFEQDGSSATVSVIVEPLVSWIWVGGLVVALGAILGMRPARERRAVAAQRPERTPVEAA